MLLLDKVTSGAQPLLIAEHADELVDVTQGFGPGRTKPEDYLIGFGKFLTENQNKVEALKLVMQRPRDLTREQLKKLKLELDQGRLLRGHAARRLQGVDQRGRRRVHHGVHPPTRAWRRARACSAYVSCETLARHWRWRRTP